jgi:predicted RNase H-like HicB family nuclease
MREGHTFTEEELNEARRYTIMVVYVPKEAIYVATMPELDELRSHGDTPQEAVENVVIAAAGKIKQYRELRIAVPQPSSVPRTC